MFSRRNIKGVVTTFVKSLVNSVLDISLRLPFLENKDLFDILIIVFISFLINVTVAVILSLFKKGVKNMNKLLRKSLDIRNKVKGITRVCSEWV